MDPRVRAQQLTTALAFSAACLLGASRAAAEPYLMVRQGAKCSDCHTNETGGGKRTAFAHIHAKEILHDLDLLPIPAGVKPFNGELNPYLSIGSDLRVSNTTVFQDRPNAAGRVPENHAFRRHVESNSTQVNEFLLYAEVDLWPDVLSLYIDEDFNGGANNREAFALIRGFLPWQTYVKAGRFFPAYGLRVWDDQTFIRAQTGFTFDNFDEGGEIGIAPGPFFLSTSVTNGDPSKGSDVLATVNGYGVFEDVPVVRNVMAGASFARLSNTRNEACVYAGSNLWNFTYLGEFDLINDSTHLPANTPRPQFVSYAEVDLLLFDWLNLRSTFDFLKASQNSNATRYTIGLQPFINHFLQPIIEYQINNGPQPTPQPGETPLGPIINRDVLWVGLHLFF